MIFIACALYEEAKSLIELYELKVVKNGRFKIYDNPDKKVVLCLTEVGRVNAAAAVSHMMTLYKASEKDFLVNIGTCAENEPAGSLYIINKITEDATARTYYPDMIYRHEMTEAQIITVDRPLSKAPADAEGRNKSGIADVPLLYDMESSAVYECAVKYISCDRVSFIKAVSDDFNDKGCSRDMVCKCIGDNLGKISEYIDKLMKIFEKDACEEEAHFGKSLTEIVSVLAEDLKCSVTMAFKLKTMLEYLTLKGENPDDLAAELKEKFSLPVKNKEEGKAVFEYIRQRTL